MYFRVSAQQLFWSDEPDSQTASNLHGRNSGDNRHDNGNDIERMLPGLTPIAARTSTPNPPAKPIPIPNLAPKKIAAKL